MGTKENSGKLNRVSSFSRHVFETNTWRTRAINVTSWDSLFARVKQNDALPHCVFERLIVTPQINKFQRTPRSRYSFYIYIYMYNHYFNLHLHDCLILQYLFFSYLHLSLPKWYSFHDCTIYWLIKWFLSAIEINAVHVALCHGESRPALSGCPVLAGSTCQFVWYGEGSLSHFHTKLIPRTMDSSFRFS